MRKPGRRVEGGAAAYPGQNGDTAKPKSGRVYTLEDWTQMLPYSRARVDGLIVRVETDGQGKLIEIVESSTNRLIYGASRGAWRTLRTTPPDKRHHGSSNFRRLAARMGRECRTLSYLAQCRLPKRPGEIAKQVGTSPRAVGGYLRHLYTLGHVGYNEQTERLNNGAYRTFREWYVTDTWREHLTNVLLELLERRPLVAQDAAELLELPYNMVVQRLARMANDGRVCRVRVGPSWEHHLPDREG